MFPLLFRPQTHSSAGSSPLRRPKNCQKGSAVSGPRAPVSLHLVSKSLLLRVRKRPPHRESAVGWSRGLGVPAKAHFTHNNPATLLVWAAAEMGAKTTTLLRGGGRQGKGPATAPGFPVLLPRAPCTSAPRALTLRALLQGFGLKTPLPT